MIQRARFTARTLREAPSLLALDRRDRGDFLRHFYRRYDGAPVEQVRSDAWELFSELLLLKSFPAGMRRIREHRALGHRTLLITGALDFVIAPMRPLFDDIVCARMGERNRREAVPEVCSQGVLLPGYWLPTTPAALVSA